MVDERERFPEGAACLMAEINGELLVVNEIEGPGNELVSAVNNTTLIYQHLESITAICIELPE